MRQYSGGSIHSYSSIVDELHEYEADVAGLKDAFSSITRNAESLTVKDAPEDLRKYIQRRLSQRVSISGNSFTDSLQRYYGTENIRNLIRKDAPKSRTGMNISVKIDNNAVIGFHSTSTRKDVEFSHTFPDVDTLLLFEDRMLSLIMPPESRLSSYALNMMVEMLWRQLLKRTGFLPGDQYYLPSARSGVLQGWQLFTSMAVQIASTRVGLDRFDVPAITGVTGDFLQTLLAGVPVPSPQRVRDRSKMAPALNFLEDQIFHGEVSVDSKRPDSPLFQYKSGSLRLPIQRASSMVAELAPLDLWIKDLLDPGDVLIIDEPEAHLHPQNQRKIASLMVRLVKLGIQVVCPTHSSTILHQISNHILSNKVSKEKRKEVGFTDLDILEPNDVSVYLFDVVDQNCTNIRPLKVSSEFGIPEDEFIAVAESLGEETYRLSEDDIEE